MVKQSATYRKICQFDSLVVNEVRCRQSEIQIIDELYTAAYESYLTRHFAAVAAEEPVYFGIILKAPFAHGAGHDV